LTNGVILAWAPLAEIRATEIATSLEKLANDFIISFEGFREKEVKTSSKQASGF